MFRKAKIHSANQEIPFLLWNKKVHYRVRESSPVGCKQIPKSCVAFHNISTFYNEELLAVCATPMLEDYPLSTTAY
jgi:hypothetical protein